MKKFILAAGAALLSIANIAAQTESEGTETSGPKTIKVLYDSDPVDVTWENTLKIDAEAFNDPTVKMGQYIYIEFSKTTDVIELKSDGTWLPGTILTRLGNDAKDTKAYMTSAMLVQLQKSGLEICGASFTVTKVSICEDGYEMNPDAIWGGYFWVDEWDTLELFKTAFDNYQGQRYLDIYMSRECDFDTYSLKVLTAWGNEDAIWANNDQITHRNYYATVDLNGINVKDKLADVNALMIQAYPGEGGKPFNITALVLRNEGATGTAEVEEADNALVDVYNMQGVLLQSNVAREEAAKTLPAGLYIIGGKKVLVK